MTITITIPSPYQIKIAGAIALGYAMVFLPGVAGLLVGMAR